MSAYARLLDRASRPVYPGSAGIFRIGFGLGGLLLVWRFFARGWVGTLFVEPAYHFTYPGFEWVRAWPGWGMHAHFALLALAAVGILIGYRTRFCAAAFAVLLAYVELIDRSLYLNHYYWMVLTALVLALLPVDRAYSVASRRIDPARRWIPVGVVWLLRFQVGMVYFFAGLAKINSDWLVHGEPLATWLPARADLPMIGPLLAYPVSALVASWLSAIFDLTIVWWLSHRRTRLVAFVVAATFHLFTWILFPSIGLFPLLMTLSALVFFEPDWPTRLIPVPASPGSFSGHRVRPGWAALTLVYVAVMLVVPLRHYFIPGDVKWTGEGYLGSWQVMLSEKSGSASFLVTDPAGVATWRVPPPGYLTPRQQVVMATDPIMIKQVADLISEDLGGAQVAADVVLSFNGRISIQYTDPTVDLSAVSIGDQSRDWLEPAPGW
ncbi:MAG TPA: HTTM domain-containing protein [Acidimicrobiia bacterium]|nr:HTTM domain-containing protein [Acidimicrobiia bacterium]